MSNGPKEALAVAAKEHASASRNWTGYCLIFVRTTLGVSSRYPSAENAYWNSRYKMGTSHTAPAGVPIWWTNGRYGHVALSAGDGYCWSTDILRTGKVDKVSIDYITRSWGQTYRGWTRDINGVIVAAESKPEPKKPAVTDAETKRRRVLRRRIRRVAANLRRLRRLLKNELADKNK